MPFGLSLQMRVEKTNSRHSEKEPKANASAARTREYLSARFRDGKTILRALAIFTELRDTRAVHEDMMQVIR